MVNQNNDTGEAFMEIVRNKVEQQDEKLSGLQQKINDLAKHSGDIAQLKKALDDIKVGIAKISFPEKEMRDLSVNLVLSTKLLKQPVENKILHHHYFPKITIIACALFIVVCLVSMGWYRAAQREEQCKASDTKYRFLKLHNSDYLRELLYFTDSIYLANSSLRDSVLQEEEDIRKKLELLQKAGKMEEEAKRLKEKAKK